MLYTLNYILTSLNCIWQFETIEVVENQFRYSKKFIRIKNIYNLESIRQLKKFIIIATISVFFSIEKRKYHYKKDSDTQNLLTNFQFCLINHSRFLSIKTSINYQIYFEMVNLLHILQQPLKGHTIIYIFIILNK